MAVTIYEGVAYPRRNGIASALRNGVASPFGNGIAAPLSGLVNAANHVNIPQDLISSTDTNPVRLCATKHTFGAADYIGMQPVWHNARYTQWNESQANYSMYISGYFLYNGVEHPLTFNGSSSAYLDKNFGTVIADPLGVKVDEGTEAYLLTKTVAADYSSAALAVAGATQTNPVVVTYTGDDPTEGDTRRFESVGGMVELNYATNGSVAYVVTNLDTGAKTFELYTTGGSPVNGTGFTPYTTGGIARRVYTHYGTTSGSTMTQDGTIYSKNDVIDVLSVARGAKLLQTIDPSKITAGVLTTGDSTILKDPDNLGQNYGAGLNLAFFYGIAGAENLGSIHRGTGAGGYGNPSAGQLGSVTITGGGSEYDVNNLPELFVGGTGSTNTGWGAGGGVFGPVAILAQPLSNIPNVLLLGDSYNASGVRFPDGSGSNDEYRYMLQGIPVQRMAVNGVSCKNWVSNNTHQMDLIDFLLARGMRYTHFYNALGVNDFRYGNTLADIRSAKNTANNLMRTRGAKIIEKLIEPSTTSTDSWLTIANQTAYSSDYDSGGTVEQYNTDMLSGSPSVPYDLLDDEAKFSRDPATTYKWNVDLFKGQEFGVITAVTKDTTASVTSPAHGLASNNYIEIFDGSTMTELTGNRYKITKVNADTFTLQTLAGVAVNSTAYTAFSGFGRWLRIGNYSADGTHITAAASQQVINYTLPFLLHGSRIDTLETLFPSNSIFDLDATIAESYTSGQVWKNLIQHPSDRTYRSAYDFNLGASSSPSTDDPTFTGSAGSPSAYWSFDGGDYFSLAGTITDFLNTLHKGRPHTLIMCFNTALNTDSTYGLFSSANTGSASQIGLSYKYGFSFYFFDQRILATNVQAQRGPISPAGAIDRIVIFSYDPVANTVTTWNNSSTGSSVSWVFTKNNDNQSGGAPSIGASGSSGKLPNGSKLYSCAMLNKAINNTDAANIIAFYNARHKRTYA